MVKKLNKLAKADDKQLASAVRTSAQQIWQAGLGAFAKAQEEGGKVFAKLVEEGTALQKRTQKLTGTKMSDMTDTVSKMADGVSRQASGSWDKLEQVFEDRVSRALSRYRRADAEGNPDADEACRGTEQGGRQAVGQGHRYARGIGESGTAGRTQDRGEEAGRESRQASGAQGRGEAGRKKGRGEEGGAEGGAGAGGGRGVSRPMR
jgi:poly(hydroxyalkanoate) granule-associated protein